MKDNIINLVDMLNSIIPYYKFYLLDDNTSIKDFINTLNKLDSSENCVVIYVNSFNDNEKNYKLSFLLEQQINLITITLLNNSTQIGPFIKNTNYLDLIKTINELTNYKKELVDRIYSNNYSIDILCNLIMLLINSTTNINNIFVINHSKKHFEIEKYTPKQKSTPLANC